MADYLISGYCYGIGSVRSKFNFSRTAALYPELRQGTTYGWNDSPIAAIEYVDFSPNKVLNLISNEDSKYENTADFYLVEIVESDGTFFPSKHYPYSAASSGKIDYLVTDTKITNGNPLFYQYELLFDAYSLEDGQFLTIYKNNEVKLDPASYIIQCSYDLLGDGHLRYTDTTWRPFDLTEQIHRIRILLPISISTREDFYVVDYKKSVYGAKTPQRELLELKSLYEQDVDFIVTSGVILTSTTKIRNDAKTLYLIKDPEDRIKPVGIEPPVYQPDQISSWRLRLNPGTLLTRSGVYNNEAGRFYFLSNVYSFGYIPITNVKPTRISENILQVGQYPIFVDETRYSYPLYQINLYDKTDLHLGADKGNVAIEVNGISRTNLKILSVDRKKGYIQLSENLDPTDEIELNFYVDSKYYLTLDNLELNPKITSGTELFKISGYMDGFGIAIREYDSGNSDTNYAYIYDSSLPASGRTYYKIPEIGGSESGIISGNFFSVCEIDVNRLSTDMVKVTDARRIAGGIRDNKELDKWFVNHSGLRIRDKDSYIGNAFYGGDPTSFGSTVIIHVPSGVILSARDKWINSLSGVVSDSIEAKDRGTREFNFYLDQLIKRYISAGTDYILIPIDASGNFMNIMNLNYDYSV